MKTYSKTLNSQRACKDCGSRVERNISKSEGFLASTVFLLSAL